jgi:putative ABC transport system substrate-binding protein
MKRRQFLIAGFACLAARAHADAAPFRIGMVTSFHPDNPDAKRFLAAFGEGMKNHRYAEGRDYILAVRYSRGDRTKIGALAEELIQWRADVLVANISSTAVEMKKRTSSIPIVMVTAVDAVGEGLVASLAHSRRQRHWHDELRAVDVRQARRAEPPAHATGAAHRVHGQSRPRALQVL